MDKVRAKMQCNSVIDYADYSVVGFHAIYGKDGSENADFAAATPSANLQMIISKGKPAREFFEQGKNYYVDFTKAE